MPKTTEQLAKECGFEFNTGLLMSYAPSYKQMESFRLAVIRDYLENSEPVAVVVDNDDAKSVINNTVKICTTLYYSTRG